MTEDTPLRTKLNKIADDYEEKGGDPVVMMLKVLGTITPTGTITPQMTECEKMVAVDKDSRVLSNFVDWLKEQGIALCDRDSNPGPEGDMYFWPIRGDFNELFARFFDIDLKKVEEERRALLACIRAKDV